MPIYKINYVWTEKNEKKKLVHLLKCDERILNKNLKNTKTAEAILMISLKSR